MDKKNIGLRRMWDKVRNWWLGSKAEPHVKAPVRFTNFLLLAFAGKSRRDYVTLPNNFDLKLLKTLYPPENYGFRHGIVFRDFKVLYILHLLSSIPGRNSDLISESGFIPIHTPTLQRHMRDYNLYLDYLVNTGVLVCDGQYIAGERSRGYKWAPRYENSVYESKLVLIGDYSQDSQIDSAADREDYPYLFYWYDQKKLQIDGQAYGYAESIRRIRMQDSTRASWDWNRDKHQYKNPSTQYMAVIRNISKITSQDYEPHIDGNVHRLHSVLTNIQKDFRNFITYDEQQLVGIDIKNCQPYLTCLILNLGFWDRDSGLPLTLYNLPDNIQQLFASEQLKKQVHRYFAALTDSDIAAYKQLVSSGHIYEEIRDIANDQITPGQVRIERDDAKILMFYLLFSGNRGQHDDPMINNLKRIFTTELYPKVAELFRIIKRNYSDCPMEDPHSRLSRMLQAIESTIILHKCCKRIWVEREHTIPIFTIHDSIVTTQEHYEYVRQVMHEELTRYIGMPPSLSIETWDIANLNQNILRS